MGALHPVRAGVADAPAQRLIALTGPARSGKNYAAALLRAQVLGAAFEDRVALVGFADGLKAAVSCMCPLYDPEDERTKELEVLPGVTGRAVLQAVGTDCMRRLHPEVFVLEAEHALDHDPDVRAAGWVVFTDLRFPNEARMIRRRGGIVVETTRKPDRPTNGIPGHASESRLPLEYVDYQLDNAQDDAVTAAHWRQVLQGRGWL